MTIPHRDGEFTFGRDTRYEDGRTDTPPFGFGFLLLVSLVLGFFAGHFFIDAIMWFESLFA